MLRKKRDVAALAPVSASWIPGAEMIKQGATSQATPKSSADILSLRQIERQEGIYILLSVSIYMKQNPFQLTKDNFFSAIEK